MAGALFLSGAAVSAQQAVVAVSEPPRLADVTAQVGVAPAAGPARHATGEPIRHSLRTLDYGAARGPGLTESPSQAGSRSRQRSVGRRILGGAIGATAGFFAGGYLGAAIEGDRCHCDDPGLKGVLIGAPIGAVAGGILGAMFF
jgi:hypothetical protein